MTPTETINLLRLVTTYAPAIRLSEGTAAVWHHALADITEEQASEAVHAHYETQTSFIMIANIRERVARSLGLLPPAEGDETDYHHPLNVARRGDGLTGFDYRRREAEDRDAVLTGNLAAQAAVLRALPPLPVNPTDEREDQFWERRRAWAEAVKRQRRERAEGMRVARAIRPSAGVVTVPALT